MSNPAFDRDVTFNPLYEGCDFSEVDNEPEFVASSLVSANPIYGDMDDFPSHMTKQIGKGF